MSDYAWTSFFDSLDFVREARIDLKKLAGVTADASNAELIAVTHASGHHRVDTTAQNDILAFSVGDIGLPVERLILQAADGRELLCADGLFYPDDSAYNNSFKSRTKRSTDPYLNYFIGRQLLQHFPGNPAFRITGAVVAAYKAVELLDPRFLDEAEEFLETSQQLIPEVPVAKSPRENREHLQLSLWCAEWHLHLAQGNFDRFLACLRKIRHHLETQKLASYFNPAFPANKSLLMLCLYFCAIGDFVEARRVAQLAVRLFKRSVKDSNQTLAHFQELGSIHKAALSCLKLVRRTEGITPEIVRSTFREAVRVGGPKYPAAFDAMIDTFNRGVSLDAEVPRERDV